MAWRSGSEPDSGGLDFITVGFLLLVAVLGVVSFTDDSRLVRIGVTVAVVIVVLTTLRATAYPGVATRLRIGAGVVLMGVIVVAWTSDLTALKATAALLVAGALGFAAYNLARSLFTQHFIRFRDVIAALTAYLQVALMFAFLYSAAAIASDDLLIGGTGNDELGELVYFSIVTITTLGFGDLAPASDLARSLVMIETVSGQMILVVLVAYLVGRIGSAAPSRRDDAAS